MKKVHEVSIGKWYGPDVFKEYIFELKQDARRFLKRGGFKYSKEDKLYNNDELRRWAEISDVDIVPAGYMPSNAFKNGIISIEVDRILSSGTQDAARKMLDWLKMPMSEKHPMFGYSSLTNDWDRVLLAQCEFILEHHPSPELEQELTIQKAMMAL